MSFTDRDAAVPGFCIHGVPCGAYCRWCREGGSPLDAARPTDAERAEARAKIRAEWDARSKVGPTPFRRVSR